MKVMGRQCHRAKQIKCCTKWNDLLSYAAEGLSERRAELTIHVVNTEATGELEKKSQWIDGYNI